MLNDDANDRQSAWLEQYDAGNPDEADLIDIFRRMATIRLCGDRIVGALRAGRLKATYYSARGQEAVAAGMAANLTLDDYLVTIYRGIHDHLAKGVPLKELWAEYAGRATGPCKGKGGPMHITHRASGTVVTTGIVGSGIPIANGLALASQVNGDGKITSCSFGDGASNIGAFHEGLNLASLWKLPVIFLCQNNGWAEHTRYANGTSAVSVADRGVAYSMPTISVDGNDPLLMWKAAREATRRARTGGGPTLIEAHTFRLEGHVFGDPSSYIPREEFDAAISRDPFPRYRTRLMDEFGIAEGRIVDIENVIAEELEEAVNFALSSPYPDERELRFDVFATETEI